MGTLTLGIFGAFVVTRWMVAMWVLAPVVSIAFVIAGIAAARRREPPARASNGSLLFRYPPRLRRCSVYFAAGFLGILTAVFVVHPPRDLSDAIAVVLAYTMFGGMAASLVWDVFRFRMLVDANGLDCRSPWRRRRFVRWEDVVDVSFDNAMGWFTVRATDGCAVYVPANVGGLGAFLEVCEQRLAPIQLVPAMAAYMFLGRPFPDE